MYKPLLLSLLFAANASAAQVAFKNIATAEQYCPAITALLYTPNNTHSQNNSGTVTGNNKVDFENISPKPAMRPKATNTNNTIKDAQFRDVAGIYGFYNKVATCFYSYTGFTGVSVALVMRGK